MGHESLAHRLITLHLEIKFEDEMGFIVIAYEFVLKKKNFNVSKRPFFLESYQLK